MNNEAKHLIEDMHAFIRYMHETDSNKERANSIIVNTLVHDMTGFLNNERCFYPRVSGYAAMMDKRQEASAHAVS